MTARPLWLAALLAGTGCWSASPSPSPSHATPATSATSATGPAAPRGPAPTVRWIDNGFDTFELPAIAADGSHVVYAPREEDGGRGHPNLALVLSDRAGAVRARRVVLSPDEVEQMFDADGMKPELRERIARANSWLARLHATHDLRPLPLLDTHNDAQGGVAGGFATGQGLRVEWAPNQLVIRHGDAVVVDTPTPTSWLAPARATCDGCPPCENVAYLAAVHADAARRLALLTISYTGTDLCWEPNSQLHVVSW